MAWSSKAPSPWDWESVSPFHTKAAAEQAQPTQWGVDNHGSSSLCSSADAAGGPGGGCRSEFGFDMAINGCSSKTPVSASMDSPAARAGPRAMVIDFEAVPTKTPEPGRAGHPGTSASQLVALPREPLIGLKLGRRTYFEDASCTETNGKTVSSPALPTHSSAATVPTPAVAPKKSRASHHSVQNPRCQVEGCNADLTAAKNYHRKHRVCESHSKCPKVIVAGQDLRFCQQCSRFHNLSEFDQKKRSCRRRLSDHNARRRKPPAYTIPFNSARLSSSLYDDRPQVNLLLSQSPFGHMRQTNSTWESSCDFKLPQVKGSWIRSTKEKADLGGQLNLPTNDLSMTVSTLRPDLDRLLPFKGTTAEVLNQGLEAPAIASNLDGAPDLRRALSLLSTDSWGSADPGPTTSISQLVHVIHPGVAQTAVDVVHTSSDYWQAEQPMAQEPQVLPLYLHSNGSQFQEFQLFKAPYENTFFDANHLD